MAETVLKVNNLCKHFAVGKKRVLKAVDDVSFEVHRGETFGLVGESGCGKTTTGRMIIRLYKPTSGEIWFNGNRIDGKLDNEQAGAVTRKMQMVFQDPIASLNPRMTVDEIICEGAVINKLYKNDIDMRKDMLKTLEMVGLTREHATRYPHEFSGGQRQRIGIARAIFTKPDLIIADEPVSALDVSMQAQVLNLLNDLRHELHLTMVFIAHDLSLVKYFSDRIAVMSRGKIVEMGNPEELFANPAHPYTRSLLSAIPIPDPVLEKARRRIAYDPSMHNYSDNERPNMIEVGQDHMAYLSQAEFAEFRGEKQ